MSVSGLDMQNISKWEYRYIHVDAQNIHDIFYWHPVVHGLYMQRIIVTWTNGCTENMYNICVWNIMYIQCSQRDMHQMFIVYYLADLGTTKFCAWRKL